MNLATIFSVINGTINFVQFC